MNDLLNKEIFSEIPLRTWGWLGVNEAPVPEGLAGVNPGRQEITVAAGQAEELVLAEREGGALELAICLEPGAKLHLVQAELAPVTAGVSSRLQIRAAAGAKFSYTSVLAGGASVAAELTVELAGQDSEADVWAFYLGDAGRRLDLNYIIRQSGRDTRANMQVRGALTGGAEKIFRGTLDFLQGAKGSVGRENEEVLLLSEDVRNRSVPLMLSHEDDVDGHHGVSVGRMDEARLFYLMSRGLDLSEAQRLIVAAAANPVLDRIPGQALGQEIYAYLQGRLAHA